MEKKYKKLIIIVYLLALLILPQVILAANPALDKLDIVAAGQNAPYAQATSASLTEIIGLVVGVVLSLIGTIFLVLMIYAGYNWMTARGEEEKVTEAKDTIMRAVIGIIIVVGSYAIWRFVFSRLF